MDVQIAPRQPERLEEYLEILRDSTLYEHYYVPDEERTLRAILSDALACGAVLIAYRHTGEAVGLMQCEWQGMFGAWPYLALLGVKKQWRGQGVGHSLLQAFERISRQMGARQIFICVSHFNPRVRALYTSFGFRKCALIDDLYRDGIQENVLRKRLDD